jgi:hypothetical protein
MAIAFTPGTTTGSGDLDIFLQNMQGNPADAASIFYTIYFVNPNPPYVETIMGAAVRTPLHAGVGEYYAVLTVPYGYASGTYRIRWTFKEFATSPDQQAAEDFAIVAPGTSVAASILSSSCS